VAFDIDTYMRVAGRLPLSDLDLETAFDEQPLDDNTLRCLQYMHDIENHTVCYLRDVLVTRAHLEPEVTAFLTVWNYEEHFHGEAIGRVLNAHDRRAGAPRVSDIRHQLGRRDRLRPVAFMIGSALVPDITAVHMTWGAVNEWTTQAGYRLLARKAQHPMLTELLGRIMRQEGRHIDYYASEARRRLSGSRAAQRVTRLALRKFWSPVGSGVRPDDEVGYLVSYLFDDEVGRAAAARIDRNIDRLPGLAGLNLLSGACERYSAPAMSGAAANYQLTK
jgi:hypothetical protein